MGWNDLDGNNAKEEKQTRHDKQEESIRALRNSARGAVTGDNQKPLRDFLFNKAYGVSYSPNAAPGDVAFAEGQRSMALQILSLSGELS